MRNKNTIIALLAIFSLICGFNLFMTWRAFSMEAELNAMDPAAADARRKDEDFRGSYEYAQRHAFSLGLDLQGGLFVTLEVGVEDILRQYAGNEGKVDPKFERALRNALNKKQSSQKDMVELFAQCLEEVYDSTQTPVPVNQTTGDKILLAHYFANESRKINSTDDDDKIKAQLKDYTNAAIENTYTIIRSRIDQFGVASPNLSLQAGSGRILLELPGVKDPLRVKALLRNSAKLEFRETVNYSKAKFVFTAMDKVVKRLKDAENGIVATDSTPKVDSTLSDSAKLAMAKADSAKMASMAGDTTDSTATAAQDSNKGGAKALFDKKDSATASTDSGKSDDPAATQQNQEQFKKDHPFLGLRNLEFEGASEDRPLMGIYKLSDTAEVMKWLNHPEVKAAIPYYVKFLWEAKPNNDLDAKFKNHLGLIAIKTNKDDKARLEGDAVVSARQEYEPNSTRAMVTMSMNSEGGKEWGRITKDNVDHCVAIVLDNLVQSYPEVKGVINGGTSQITGNFSVEEAKDLANLLKAGALPVKAKILGDSLVGPTMGASNLNKGLVSFLVAFFAVIAFMGYYYRGAGMVANLALIVNLVYIFAVSAALNVVFTLPGLAAVVLTMGMAVDANVLVFERVREEMESGKSYKGAVAAGFKNAFSTIMDSNITTFLTGLILFYFGIGPIAGFAVSLMIGIVTSLICSLFLTRLILEWFGDRKAEGVKFGSKFTLNLFNHVKIKMTQRKKAFYLFSGILTALSFASVAAFGFKTGVEFEGGRQIKVEFAKDINPEDYRGPLTAAFDNKVPLIRTISGANTILITTSYKLTDTTGSEVVNKMILEEITKVSPDAQPKILESVVVGPTVANDIQRSAVFSVIFSLIAIFLYILLRFRRYQYSIGALAALVHDVSIVMGFYSFFGHFEILPFSLELDQAFIAAVLTVIGFSINDTVIVFDRIRENLSEMKSSPLGLIYDVSIDRTFSRTIITSGTVLLTILIMFFFAGDVVRSFMFALLIGIGVGTYSSIFVASPIAYDMIRSVEGENREKLKAKSSSTTAPAKA
jgi:SecD/SecF fusion protein